MGKVPQKYPDLTKVRLAINTQIVVDAVIIFKNVSRYAVAYEYGGRKDISHITENRLTDMIEKAKIIDSPLNKALLEDV
jgi:hypothetical protein